MCVRKRTGGCVRVFENSRANVIEVVDVVVVDGLLSNEYLFCGGVEKAVAKRIGTGVVEKCVRWKPELFEFVATR